MCIRDRAQVQQIDSIRIKWVEPYATRFLVQHWIGDDPMHAPTRGVWQTFPLGAVEHGHGGSDILRLNASPLAVRFLRILMTESSNTCGAGNGSADPRACLLYTSIDKRGVIPVGRIVNGVAIGVRERELKSTRIPPARDLQRVIVGDPSADNAIDRVVTRIGPVII